MDNKHRAYLVTEEGRGVLLSVFLGLCFFSNVESLDLTAAITYTYEEAQGIGGLIAEESPDAKISIKEVYTLEDGVATREEISEQLGITWRVEQDELH